MKRKIHFVVTIADYFVDEPLGMYHMPISRGSEIMYRDLVIEYKQTLENNPMPEAFEALAKWVAENHPTKAHMVYYWTLEIV